MGVRLHHQALIPTLWGAVPKDNPQHMEKQIGFEAGGEALFLGLVFRINAKTRLYVSKSACAIV